MTGSLDLTSPHVKRGCQNAPPKFPPGSTVDMAPTPPAGGGGGTGRAPGPASGGPGGHRSPPSPGGYWAQGLGRLGTLGRGCLRQGLVSAYFLSDKGGVGQLGVQEVQLQGLQGALQQLQQETEQSCRRELQQVHGQLAGKAWGSGLRGSPLGLGFLSQAPSLTRTSGTHGQPPPGLRGPPRPGQHLYPELSGFTERGPGPGQDQRLPLQRVLPGQPGLCSSLEEPLSPTPALGSCLP